MSTDSKHLVIAAAGTGGHVMPGLAVAAVMKARGWRVSWIGTTTGMEAGLVAKHGIDFYGLNFQGIRGKGVLGAAKGAMKLFSAYWKARELIDRLKPDAVFSTGGYVAVPVGFAGRGNRRPLILMNCDADILMSTKTLLPICEALACGFAGSARTYAKAKGLTTGNPVRSEIVAIEPPEERLGTRQGPLRLFVFGGSLGAQVFNDIMPQVMARIPAAERPEIVHQTGKNRDEAVRKAYNKLGVKATVVPFIDDMAERYRECDAVICRAGATSLSELCSAGVPAILVPLVVKTTAHQMGNARFLADKNAAILVPQKDFTIDRMAEMISGLTREGLLEMAKNARSIARPHAAEAVADLIEAKLAEKKAGR